MSDQGSTPMKRRLDSTQSLTNKIFLNKLVGDESPQAGDDSIQDTVSPLDFIPYGKVADVAEGAGQAIARRISAQDAGGFLADEAGFLRIGSDPSVKIMSREQAESSGVKIPSQHLPSGEIDKEIGYNHRLNGISDINYVVKNNKVVGHLGVDDDGSVKSVAIDPKYQRQGFAQSLYEQYFKDNGQLKSDDPSAMEPSTKALWEKLRSSYPDHITKTNSGYQFQGDSP